MPAVVKVTVACTFLILSPTFNEVAVEPGAYVKLNTEPAVVRPVPDVWLASVAVIAEAAEVRPESL